jgi:hypothetical protein
MTTVLLEAVDAVPSDRCDIPNLNDVDAVEQWLAELEASQRDVHEMLVKELDDVKAMKIERGS